MWLTVLAGAAGCYALKLAGVAIPQSVLSKEVVHRITLLLPIALLSALVAVQTVADRMQLVIDARVPAFVVSIIALKFRAPFIVVVLLAALSAAGLRYFGLLS